MPNQIGPIPPSVPPGSAIWNQMYDRIRILINTGQVVTSWSNITGTPTTLAGYGITDAQATSAKDAASGYAGLNSSSRITKGVDTTDDITTDSTTKGPVLKSPNAHYWRATISNAGALTWTDLGTTKP